MDSSWFWKKSPAGPSVSVKLLFFLTFTFSSWYPVTSVVKRGRLWRRQESSCQLSCRRWDKIPVQILCPLAIRSLILFPSVEGADRPFWTLFLSAQPSARPRLRAGSASDSGLMDHNLPPILHETIILLKIRFTVWNEGSNRPRLGKDAPA